MERGGQKLTLKKAAFLWVAPIRSKRSGWRRSKETSLFRVTSRRRSDLELRLRAGRPVRAVAGQHVGGWSNFRTLQVERKNEPRPNLAAAEIFRGFVAAL